MACPFCADCWRMFVTYGLFLFNPFFLHKWTILPSWVLVFDCSQCYLLTSITVDHPQCCRHRRRWCYTFSMCLFVGWSVGRWASKGCNKKIIFSVQHFCVYKHQQHTHTHRSIHSYILRCIFCMMHLLCNWTTQCAHVLLSIKCVIALSVMNIFWPSSSILEIFLPNFI